METDEVVNAHRRVYLLLGCSSKQWYHQDSTHQTNAVFARDQADCVQTARALVGESVGEVGSYEYGLWRLRLGGEFNRCMASRGWYLK